MIERFINILGLGLSGVGHVQKIGDHATQLLAQARCEFATRSFLVYHGRGVRWMQIHRNERWLPDMRVVLLKDVKRLGVAGEVRSVADGYARNYLIPRGLATPATDAALQQVKAKAAARSRQASQEKEQAQTLAERLEGAELVFQAKAGETGRLYGAITNADIAERLTELAGEAVDKRKVVLPEPIKDLGKSHVQIKLHGDVVVRVTVIVEPEEES